MQPGHVEGIGEAQLGQQSKLPLECIKSTCKGNGPAIFTCLQAVSAAPFARHGSDLGALYTSCSAKHHLLPLRFVHLAVAKHFLTATMDNANRQARLVSKNMRQVMDMSGHGLASFKAGRVLLWP